MPSSIFYIRALLFISAVGLLVIILYVSYITSTWDVSKIFISYAEQEECLNTCKGDGGGRGVMTPLSTETPKVTNVLFLKTHKTASSTLQNILMRFGETRKLTFALGATPDVYKLGYPMKFTPGFTLASVSGKFDILCHHARYSSAMTDIMPRGTVFISIVRHPVKLTESWFVYNKIADRRKVDIETFLEDPQKHYSRYGYVNGVAQPFPNSILFDFGLDPVEALNQTKVSDKILEIDERFSLVMLAEYFDESLILLKNLLGWSFHDIVYFAQNMRKETTQKTFDQSTVQNIKKIHAGDLRLYEHFNKTFWRKVHIFGEERMQRELEEFYTEKESWEKRCISEHASFMNISDKKFRPYESMVLGYNLLPEIANDTDCVLMATPELPFTRRIYKRMVDMGQLKKKAINVNLVKEWTPFRANGKH